MTSKNPRTTHSQENSATNFLDRARRISIMFLGVVAISLFIAHKVIEKPPECTTSADCFGAFTCVNGRCDCTWQDFGHVGDRPYKCDPAFLAQQTDWVYVFAQFFFYVALLIFIIFECSIFEFMRTYDKVTTLEKTIQKLKSRILMLETERQRDRE